MALTTVEVPPREDVKTSEKEVAEPEVTLSLQLGSEINVSGFKMICGEEESAVRR